LGDREKVLADAKEKFSTERKDHEIQRLSLENSVRNAEVVAGAWKQRLWATAALALALEGVLAQMVARARRRNRVLEDSNAVLSDLSAHDPLTVAFNRRHGVSLMGQQETMLSTKSRDRNYKASVGLMLLDVDHFKHVNDTYGHTAGGVVLIEIAHRLQKLVRSHTRWSAGRRGIRPGFAWYGSGRHDCAGRARAESHRARADRRRGISDSGYPVCRVCVLPAFSGSAMTRLLTSGRLCDVSFEEGRMQSRDLLDESARRRVEGNGTG
jgi:hypothetical protein